MNASGTYVVSGGFDKGMKGDMISGLLALRQGADESVPPTGNLAVAIVLAGRRKILPPCAVNDLRITPAGGISFGIRGGPGAWSFSGFLSGGAITGRHGFERGGPKKPLQGPWTGVRVHGPLAKDPAAIRAADALLASPEDRAKIAAVLKSIQRKLD